MQFIINSHNKLSKNRRFVFIKSLLTSPLFITIYCIFATALALFLIYKGLTGWYWLNVTLIEQGYLPKLPDARDTYDLAVRWCFFQFFIIFVSILLISLICIIICITIDHVKNDLDKFDIETQQNSLKRKN